MSLALNIISSLLFTEIQKLPPSMHLKWNEINDFLCKTTNRKIVGDKLPTKSPSEFKGKLQRVI